MRWALIGASRIASSYMIDAMRAGEGSSIASVLSSDAARGEAYAREHGIARSFTDLNDLLGDDSVDAVYISTTNEKNIMRRRSRRFPRASTFCVKKPLAMTLDEAGEMVRAADERGVVFATNHHLRNAGSHLAIRELIRSGRIGRVLSARVFHAVNLPEVLRGWRINNAAAGGAALSPTLLSMMRTRSASTWAKIRRKWLQGQALPDWARASRTASCPSGRCRPAPWWKPMKASPIPLPARASSFTARKGRFFARNVMTQEPVGDIRLVDASGETPIPFEKHNLYEYSLGLFLPRR
ncbi:Gfo/Idh/MocA family oxidoreductase [Roseibium salinum]|nr:Gfo/Idh/MocA family oxidoreductase [Roseibium salinum]